MISWEGFQFLVFSVLMLVIGFLIGEAMCNHGSTQVRYIIIKEAQIEKNLVAE